MVTKCIIIKETQLPVRSTHKRGFNEENLPTQIQEIPEQTECSGYHDRWGYSENNLPEWIMAILQIKLFLHAILSFSNNYFYFLMIFT